MNYESAMQRIRRKCRKDSAIKAVFKAIYENRYSHPVRDWAIYDLQRKKGWRHDTAVNYYNRHLARLYEIFGISLPSVRNSEKIVTTENTETRKN